MKTHLYSNRRVTCKVGLAPALLRQGVATLREISHFFFTSERSRSCEVRVARKWLEQFAAEVVRGSQA